MIECYELRLSDGIINTHKEVVKQVKLMQTKLREAHCFNDLKSNGAYDKTTREAIALMKLRISMPDNDKCNRFLWSYLLEEDLNDIVIVPKPNNLELPKGMDSYGIDLRSFKILLSRLTAIPCFKELSENQIKAMLLYSYRTGYEYGSEHFKSLNKIFKMRCLGSIPTILLNNSTPKNRNLRLQEIEIWNHKD